MTETPVNNTNMDPTASLRVPAVADQTVTNTVVDTTENPTPTFQTVNRPKRRRNRGKMAANQDTIQNIALYTEQLLKSDPQNTEHTCYAAIHPDTGLPAEYCDLRTSSKGAEWIIETADEMG